MKTRFGSEGFRTENHLLSENIIFNRLMQWAVSSCSEGVGAMQKFAQVKIGILEIGFEIGLVQQEL